MASAPLFNRHRTTWRRELFPFQWPPRNMWNPQTMELMPGFWPPRPAAGWNVALSPLRRYYLHQFYRISEVEVIGTEQFGAQSGIAPGDGVLIAPNHSHD